MPEKVLSSLMKMTAAMQRIPKQEAENRTTISCVPCVTTERGDRMRSHWRSNLFAPAFRTKETA